MEPEIGRSPDFVSVFRFCPFVCSTQPVYDPAAPIVCELCGAVMRYTASCKITCGNCGYKRDCSDP